MDTNSHGSKRTARTQSSIGVHPWPYHVPVDDEGAPQPEYSEDGVDVTLIRWFLTLTPAERLALLEERINGIQAIRQRNARN